MVRVVDSWLIVVGNDQFETDNHHQKCTNQMEFKISIHILPKHPPAVRHFSSQRSKARPTSPSPFSNEQVPQGQDTNEEVPEIPMCQIHVGKPLQFRADSMITHDPVC